MSLKTYAFIDSQNLNLSIRNDLKDKRGRIYYHGWRLDFTRFYVYLRDKYKVEKTFLFIGYVAGNESLYQELQEAGYLLIFKPTLEYQKGKEKIIKGNVDAELVLHSMIEYKNYDKVIIVAGDGDYHCLIEYLDKQKKLLYVLIPNKYSHSSLLRKFRQYFVFVNELRKKLSKENKKERE
ncbi:MAG: NYN domain-containing protein [Candidatus Daviesbacteria bacterium]